IPYVAPEVLRGGSYTQAADIYSFGMIMYFIVTGKQPFENLAHDQYLALNICNGIRPEISEPEAPKWYIDLMKKCLDSNPTNRPNVEELSTFFDNCTSTKNQKNIEYHISFLKIEYQQFIQKLFINLEYLIHLRKIFQNMIIL
ncbi:kinase-like domain-containing protein, partial [Glomus cerebriforme]